MGIVFPMARTLKAIIVVGDRTNHGGTVISGDPTVDIDGKAVARVGDMVNCPRCRGTYPIVTGALDTVLSGKPVARHGDTTSCGATLISSQILTNWSDECGSIADASPGSKGNGVAAYVSPTSAGASEQADRQEMNNNYDQSFVLQDDITGQLLADRSYRIKWSGGVIEGRTDSAGLTKKISGSRPEKVTIEVYGEGV